MERHPEARGAHVIRHNKSLRARVFERDDGICRVRHDDTQDMCGRPVDPDNWELDHILPILMGGPNTIDNLRVAHPICNRRRPRRLTQNQIENCIAEWHGNETARLESESAA